MKAKRVLSLALVMALVLMPTAALAADYTVEEVVPVGTYFDIDFFSDGLACVTTDASERGKYDNKRGYIDTTGKVVIPCIYDWGERFTHGLAEVGMGENRPGEEMRFGVIDKAGNEVVPIGKYSGVEVLSANLIAVAIPSEELNSFGSPYNKWGVIDITGKEIIPFKYDGISSSSAENLFLAWIRREGIREYMGYDEDGRSAYHYGYVDFTGKEITPFKYSNVYDFYDGYALVQIDGGDAVFELNHPGKWGIIDTTGKEVVPCKYDDVNHFSDGLALVKRNERYGYVNTSGKVVIPFQYFEAQPFSEGLAEVESAVDDGKGYIDTTGKIVIPFQYETQYFADDRFFSEGLVAVGNRGISRSWVWGFMDNTGKEVVPPQYYTVRDFHEGFAAVEGKNEKWGFIDTAGKEIVPCQYDEVGDGHGMEPDVQYGFAPVRQYGDYSSNAQWGLLGFYNNATTAFTSTQEVDVDGEKVTFQCYALKDENGNLTNYIKLRDLAGILNGTSAQFQVGWDGSVNILTQQAYTPNGSEGSTPFRGHRPYREAANPTKVNGQAADLAAFVLSDDQGGGYTYYKLRDLAQALGFNVGWSSKTGVYVETAKPYDPNN